MVQTKLCRQKCITPKKADKKRVTSLRKQREQTHWSKAAIRPEVKDGSVPIRSRMAELGQIDAS